MLVLRNVNHSFTEQLTGLHIKKAKLYRYYALNYYVKGSEPYLYLLSSFPTFLPKYYYHMEVIS
jgi:hypothetical protein